MNLDLAILIQVAIGVAILYAIKKALELPLWVLKNSIAGAIMLYIFNLFGFFTLKVTFVHCLIVGVLGIPGLIGLIIYFYQIVPEVGPLL